MCLQATRGDGFAEVPLTDKDVCYYRAAEQIGPRPVRFQKCCKQGKKSQEANSAEHSFVRGMLRNMCSRLGEEMFRLS